MQVIIAEKPSVAREIAAIVGARNRKEGYIEGNGYAVTWAFGHLVGLAMPQQYGIEGFRAENLPILPPKFTLLPRQIRDGKEYKSDPGVLKQLSVIKELFNMAGRIIVATDAGREGELIFRYIYSFLECRKPFVRLWISSLTDNYPRGVAESPAGRGVRQPLPLGQSPQRGRLGRRHQCLAGPLYRCRTRCVVAGTCSDAHAGYYLFPLSGKQGFHARNLFPVQTLYGQRCDALRRSFDTTVRRRAYGANSLCRRHGCQQGARRRSRVQGGKEQPPLLYDLTTLQKDANTHYGFSADKTLGIAQTLYEKKHITYPRTGSRHIPKDVAAEIRPLFLALRNHPQFGPEAVAVAESEINRRSIDNDKVTDHHALLITEVMPTGLPAEEQTIYDLIAGRMVEAFGKVCMKEVSTARLECGSMEFVAKGTVIRDGGWRKVWREPEERTDDMTAALPALRDGDELPVKGCDVERRQTKPRPIHTEGSLLAAMETVGRELTDEAEREAMKDSGIGTPATRAAIIETLFARDYIRREKNRSFRRIRD